MGNTNRNIFLLLAVLVLVVGGCTKVKNDVNQVATDAYLAKSELQGKIFSAVKTIVSGDEHLDDLGVIPGFHADLGYVEFVITEKQLQVRKVGEPDKIPSTATIVASYPILSHFDVKREVNDFGEETNKIIEDQKRPWNERTQMRVDFGTNSNSTTKLTNVFSTEIVEEDSKVVSPLIKEAGMLSYDVDANISQKDNFQYYGSVQEQVKYNSFRAQIKTTFMEVKPSDYKPYEMSNKEFTRFGYFRTFENFLDPDKGATVSGRKLFANKFNVCENTAKTAGLSCATNKIIYTLNKDFPEEFKQPSRDVVAAWNKSFQKALGRTDDVVVLDESIEPEIGDTRYNMIAGINEKLPTGLLGVSQTVNNPNTGETLAARASVYLGTVRLLGANAGDQLDMLINSQVGDLKSASLEKDINSQLGANALITKLKTRKAMLAAQYKAKQKLLKAQPIKSAQVTALKTLVRENQATAQARRKEALAKVPNYFEISDSAFREMSKDSVQKAKFLNTNLFLGNGQEKEKLQHLSQAEKGIHGAELVEPAIERFIALFIKAHQGQSAADIREQLKTEVRRLVYYTTLIHEMGHNFGLRHNFASSSDRKNYTDEYYNLEKKKQTLAVNDPKRDDISLEQESYDFSSVMDYTGSFNETMGGTGHYDDAAIRYAYNTSIDKDGDPITGIVRGYKFCTDHEVGEDLMCARFDKGTNVTTATVRTIEGYNRDYIFRNFRRDRANFGGVGSYFNRVLTRVMLPVRQVNDEMIYKLITSPTVAAGENQCDMGFLRDSIEAGEVANICDSSVIAKYAEKGVSISGWGDFVYLLLKDDLSGFRKDPTTYKASGFADLLFANYQATNFFVSVIGTPEPGQYYPISNGAGGYTLEALPGAGSSDEARLTAYFVAKGADPAQVAAAVGRLKTNIVDLNPGPQAKYFSSRQTQDGSFKQVEVMGYLYDKIAAMIIMGARGLPVEKYQEISMNTNMYFAPQTKEVSSQLMNALINENPLISSLSVTTRGGASVLAGAPASMDLNTKYYGLITALTDFISDQSQEFADKMKICNANESCTNALGLPEATFIGANGQNTYKAVQVAAGDSVAYEIVAKGAEISKQRDSALKDIANSDQLIKEAQSKLASSPAHQKSLMSVLTAKAPSELVEQLKAVYGDQEGSVWKIIVAQASDIKSASGQQASQIKSALAGIFSQVDSMIEEAIKDEDAKKEIQTARELVDQDLTEMNELTFRVSASPILVQNITSQLAPIEDNARTIIALRKTLNIQ